MFQTTLETLYNTNLYSSSENGNIMALKTGPRSKRSKRICNVFKREDSKSDEVNFSSSDSESGPLLDKNQVRDGLSTKALLRESECYKVDDDHIYTSVRSCKSMYESSRKRKISKGGEEPSKQRCVSKNAVKARLNRERKKRYVSLLETKNESLLKENNQMKRKIETYNKNICTMRREIMYLKGLLANSKDLGQILKNLSDTTGLPVTSSMVPTNKICSRNDTSEKSHVSDAVDNDVEGYQPRIRSVYSGANFPILDKDINLGSCSDKSISDGPDLEYYPFQFENDSYDGLHPIFSDDDFLLNHCDSQDFNYKFEETLKSQDLSTNRDPNVGICLHVNQRHVSVEICSICNNRANSSYEDMPNDL